MTVPSRDRYSIDGLPRKLQVSKLHCVIRFNVRGGATWTMVFLLVAARAQAIDMFWSNNRGDGSGTFSLASNWTSSVPFFPPPPDDNDVAHFGMTTSNLDPKTYTVAFTSNATTNALIIEDDRVSFALNGHTYTNSHDPFATSTRIGDQSGRIGGLSVTNGLLDVQGVLFVGVSGGTGNLTVTQSGSVQSDFFARVGSVGSSGTVTVNGAGSQWIHDGEFSVGWGGTGVMSITGGALVQNGSGLVADVVAPATGTVTVSGVNSRWLNSGTLLIGDVGHGVLNISAGGQVNAASAVVGNQSGAVGEVNVDGPNSMLSSSATILVSSFSPGTGTLTVSNGGTVAAPGGLLVRVLGTLRGDGHIIGGISNVGVVAPGTSPGALHVTGSFAQGASGKLKIDLAGTTPGTQYDQLLVSGAVTPAGMLEVSLVDGFQPAAGMSFDILDFGSISGTFDSLVLPALNSGLEWDTSQLYATGVISVGLPGDFDHNGVIDAADFVVWRKGLGTIFSQADYDVWRFHFGQSAGTGAGSIANAAVPEPTSAWTLLVGLLTLCLRRRVAASPIR